jgi:hypothetical protein
MQKKKTMMKTVAVRWKLETEEMNEQQQRQHWQVMKMLMPETTSMMSVSDASI